MAGCFIVALGATLFEKKGLIVSLIIVALLLIWSIYIDSNQEDGKRSLNDKVAEDTLVGLIISNDV